jgi:hypothetical protein
VRALTADVAELDSQLGAHRHRMDRIRHVLGPYADVLDDDAKLDPLAEASLKTIELRARLDQEVDNNRALLQEKEEMVRELKKLRMRMER